MYHVKVVDQWEEGTPTPIPSDASVRAHSGGEISDLFFATVYVDDYLLIRVQHSGDDKTALNCIGLSRFGSRALIRIGGARGVTHFSSKEEYELGLHS